VLQEPDEIVEYGITTLAARRTLKVPRRLIEHPGYLSINARDRWCFFLRRVCSGEPGRWRRLEIACGSGMATRLRREARKYQDKSWQRGQAHGHGNGAAMVPFGWR
jgi:hypothetical protein